MDKTEFLLALSQGIQGLNYEEQDKWLDFYSEAIDDRMEEGLTEEEAVEAIGTVNDVIDQILAQSRPEKKAKKKRELKTWHWVVLIAGSPVWFSLLIAVASTVFSLIVAAWSLVISFYAVSVSLIVSGAACALAPFVMIPLGAIGACAFSLQTGLVCAGVGLFCIGLGIFWFVGTHYMTKGVVWLCKRLFAALIPPKEAAR